LFFRFCVHSGGFVIGGVVDPVDGGVVIGGVVDPVDGGVVIGGVVDPVNGGVVIGGVVDPVDGGVVIGKVVPVCDRVVAVIVRVIVGGPVGVGHACVEQDSLNSGAFVTMNGNWISVGAAKFITHS
jgi:hypothetical protein